MPATQFYMPPLVSRSPQDAKNAINQITKIVLADGVEVAFTDWTDRVLYSAVDTLSGWSDQELRAFNYVEGDPVTKSNNILTARVATEQDTNLQSASEMDATEEFLCYSLQNEVYQLIYDNSNPNAGHVISETGLPGLPIPRAGVMGVLHWRIGVALEVSQKFFPHLPFGYALAGFGPVVVSTVTDTTMANNGQQGHHARFDQSVPIHIGGTEKFNVVLQNQGVGAAGDGTVLYPTDQGTSFPSATTPYVVIRIGMRGLHKRPMG